VKRGGSLSFLIGTISNILVMEIGWTDVGSGNWNKHIDMITKKVKKLSDMLTF
jgi:hypothetical protein